MAVRWGILATGNIGRTFAKALQGSSNNELVAVGSRSESSATQFAAKFGDIRAHATYEALLADADVDAIYVSTPHTEHAAWTIRALRAGKAVLCEKPLALNHAQAMAMIEEAKRNQCFLMEAFMYRLHPQMVAVQEQIASGGIGEVRHIEAQFGYHTPFNADARHFSNDLAGGGILDVGCYPLSFARTILQAEPNAISAHAHLGQTGVDEWSSALLKFDQGISAQIAAAISVNMNNHATIYGSEGHILLANPWLPNDQQGNWSFDVVKGQEKQTISGQAANLWQLEADHVADCLSKGLLESPVITWEESLNNAIALDQWRRAVKLTFNKEQPQAHSGPILGQLAKPANKIPMGRVKHLDKDVSRIVMGCDNQPSMSHASVMWDDYFEAGGNCFDTAHVYGNGSMEALVGHWHTQRGLRDDIVIIGKGAHTPNNYPSFVSSELNESLERLQTDHVDIYFLHRDNLDIPVGEFIDALNQEVQAGRIRAFGGSNWSLERVQQANAYAQDNGLQGFTAISNNFSLAHMNMPIWPGTESSSDDAWVTYLKESQIALMPWSSQARGFFTPWTDQVVAQEGQESASITGAQPTIAELKRVWFSPENFARRERAAELAEKHGVPMINIALAYVLNQAFPTFPLIGPRLLSETASCLDSLAVNLGEDDVNYLNLKS